MNMNGGSATPMTPDATFHVADIVAVLPPVDAPPDFEMYYAIGDKKAPTRWTAVADDGAILTPPGLYQTLYLLVDRPRVHGGGWVYAWPMRVQSVMSQSMPLDDMFGVSGGDAPRAGARKPAWIGKSWLVDRAVAPAVPAPAPVARAAPIAGFDADALPPISAVYRDRTFAEAMATSREQKRNPELLTIGGSKAEGALDADGVLHTTMFKSQAMDTKPGCVVIIDNPSSFVTDRPFYLSPGEYNVIVDSGTESQRLALRVWSAGNQFMPFPT